MPALAGQFSDRGEVAPKIYKNEDKLPNACADSLITLWHVIAIDKNLKEELILN